MLKQENPIDYVLDRMVETVVGTGVDFKSHADALGIPAETIKTWRRRREVPPGRLAAFAQDWKVSVDWLLRGDHTEAHQVNENVAPYGLSGDEAALLEVFRRSTPELRAAARRVLEVNPQGKLERPARITLQSGVLAEKKILKKRNLK